MGSLRVGEKMLSDAAWQGTYRVPSVFPLYRHTVRRAKYRARDITYQTEQPMPSRMHPHALLSILSIAGWSQYAGSSPTTVSAASSFAIQTPRGRCGYARTCTSAPHPFVFRAALPCALNDEDGQGEIDEEGAE